MASEADMNKTRTLRREKVKFFQVAVRTGRWFPIAADVTSVVKRWGEVVDVVSGGV